MIHIREKDRPFSHKFNSRCYLPGTSLVVEGTPERILIGDLDVFLGHDPYAGAFTQILDLERNCVWVSGKGFRVKVSATEAGIFVGNQFFEHNHSFYLPEHVERLSFGVQKTQDWDLVLRRMDIKEILPWIYHLSQKFPKEEKDASFQDLPFFEGILLPKQRSGWKGAFEQIRSRFFLEQGNQLTLLPMVPSTYGRMKNIRTNFGSIDMNWVKGTLQRVVIHIEKENEISVELPKEIRSFRVKRQLHDRGVIVKVGESLKLSPGKLFLDRFYR